MKKFAKKGPLFYESGPFFYRLVLESDKCHILDSKMKRPNRMEVNDQQIHIITILA